jgi:putative ABC transport system permease protein
MLQDLRYTLRSIAKRPSFAIGTMLVLGLAVGVNTAVFSLINALLLRPLPVPNPDRLAFIYHSDERRSIPYEWYRGLLGVPDVFSGLAARANDAGRLRVGLDVIPLQGEVVTPDYFDVLEVSPLMGRVFSASENSAAASPVAIISAGLWKAHYAADPNVLGRVLRIDASGGYVGSYGRWRDYTIVGVMPEAFTGAGNPWQPADYWVLIEQRAADIRESRYDPRARARENVLYRPAWPIGRLAPGVSLQQARAAVESAMPGISQHSANALNPGETLRVVGQRRVRLPFQGAYFMEVPRITATLGAVGTILLLIAAVNLAGMLLARGVTRRAEIAIRVSLGVGRARLARQLLAESVVLAIGAGAAGLAVARLLVVAAVHGLPSQIPGSTAAFSIDVPVDVRVIAFAFGSGLLTAVSIGLAPVYQALRIDLLAALGGAATSTGQSRSRLRRLVLIPQIALALVLLLVTGVFVRAMLRVELTPPGYDPERVVTLDVQVPRRDVQPDTSSTAELAARSAMQQRLLERLRALPGVTAAALTEGYPDGIPLAAAWTSLISRTDYESTRQYRGVTMGYVSADYFKTMGIPILRGRDFDAREQVDPRQSVIVSARLAGELWPGGDPLGQQIALHSADSQYPIRWRTVIGVAASATRPQDEYPRPVFYAPIDASPLAGTRFLVQSTGNPAAMVAAAKQAVAAVDASLIVAQGRPLAETVSAVRYPRRFSAALLGVSGAAALLLAAIGVFALMSYAVAQRLGEIGVRMVLGAGRRDVIRLILRDGTGVALAGIGLGFALAFAAIRYASHAIVPLPDADAATFIAVPVVLSAVVLFACYLPARRAARVDPLVVLRQT